MNGKANIHHCPGWDFYPQRTLLWLSRFYGYPASLSRTDAFVWHINRLYPWLIATLDIHSRHYAGLIATLDIVIWRLSRIYGYPWYTQLPQCKTDGYPWDTQLPLQELTATHDILNCHLGLTAQYPIHPWSPYFVRSCPQRIPTYCTLY
jgi:hypothetical protein